MNEWFNYTAVDDDTDSNEKSQFSSSFKRMNQDCCDAKKLTKFFFTQVKHPETCLDTSTKCITKFDHTKGILNEWRKFMNDYAVFTPPRKNEEGNIEESAQKWQVCFTEPISDDQTKTVIHFKPKNMKSCIQLSTQETAM